MLDYIVDSIGLPGYMFPYLVGYILVFENANFLIGKIKSIRLGCIASCFVVVNSIGIWLFYNNIYSTNSFAAYLLGMICALSWICLMIIVCGHFPSSKCIVWLSGISFEVYLVHEFFLGRYSVYNHFSLFSGFFVLITLSVISAFVLHKVSSHNLP